MPISLAIASMSLPKGTAQFENDDICIIQSYNPSESCQNELAHMKMPHCKSTEMLIKLPQSEIKRYLSLLHSEWILIDHV